jgi:hypothetical protein
LYVPFDRYPPWFVLGIFQGYLLWCFVRDPGTWFTNNIFFFTYGLIPYTIQGTRGTNQSFYHVKLNRIDFSNKLIPWPSDWSITIKFDQQPIRCLFIVYLFVIVDHPIRLFSFSLTLWWWYISKPSDEDNSSIPIA